MDVQKILNDYIQSISAICFQIVNIYEADVTEEYLVMIDPRDSSHCIL